MVVTTCFAWARKRTKAIHHLTCGTFLTDMSLTLAKIIDRMNVWLNQRRMLVVLRGLDERTSRDRMRCRLVIVTEFTIGRIASHS